jgi:hypothetical protein
MPRLNIRIDTDLHNRVHDEIPHGLQESLMKNLINMALNGEVNPRHIAVAKRGEYKIVRVTREESHESHNSVENGERVPGS